LSHPRRRPFAVARDRLSRHPLLLPLAILAAAAAFRFYNLNWDNGQLLHPDERGIIMLITGSNNAGHPLAWPSSLSQFFDTRVGVGSPLDPHYFAYGSLPYYLLAFLAGAISFLGQHIPLLSQWSHVDTYGGLPLLARGLSAVLDLISVGVVFLIARRIYGYWTAVLAMALMAFTVLDVQMAHFFQVDSLLLPLALLTVLAAIIIVQTNARSAYVWGGIALGAALATKTTALLLVIPLGAAAILAAWYQAGGEGIPHDDGTSEVRATPPGMAGRAPNPAWAWAVRQYSRVGVGLNGNLQWLLGSYAIAALAFALLDPYAILERHTLVADVAQQSQLLVTNNPPFGAPYTIQYAGTLPYLYQLTNLLFWCMGIPLALAAFAGALFALVRNIGFKVRPAEAVLLLWVLPYFLFVGRFSPSSTGICCPSHPSSPS
jgi:4-amino-4-deoxy-L-arabinose transferase-like glycosyltransferase